MSAPKFTHVYLASSSPRRAEILTEFNIPFTLIPNQLDPEPTLDPSHPLRSQVEALSALKAKTSKADYPGPILSADTIVIHNRQILGKPTSENDAIKMLKSLSGTSHTVLSAFALFDPKTNTVKTGSDEATVRFNPLTDDQIRRYIHEFQPFDKAGSYGIQELPKGFLNTLSGSYYTVMGFPIDVFLGSDPDS